GRATGGDRGAHRVDRRPPDLARGGRAAGVETPPAGRVLAGRFGPRPLRARRGETGRAAGAQAGGGAPRPGRRARPGAARTGRRGQRGRYLRITSCRRSSGRAWTVRPLNPVIVSAAVIELRIASCVASAAARNSVVMDSAETLRTVDTVSSPRTALPVEKARK